MGEVPMGRCRHLSFPCLNDVMKQVKNKVVMVEESGDEDIVIPDLGDQEQGGEVLHHLMIPVTKVDDYWLWKSIFQTKCTTSEEL